MKILWHSCSPLIPSGYGSQTALIVPRLKAAGHEVAISCHAGQFGAVTEWQGIRLFPHSSYPAQYGMDIVEHHASHFKPDICISWMDAFALQVSKISNLPWAAWVPVDSWPLMKRNIEPLKACKWIIAPTEWGRTAIEKVELKVDVVIPCAYDPAMYYPIDCPMAELRAELSKVINVEIGDKFLVNVVSANSGVRKNFSAVLESWGEFHANHPNSMLFLHTDPTGYFFQGENLNDVTEAMRIDKTSVFFPPQWEYVCGTIGTDFLNLLYNCSDLHLNTCLGEGFGLPILDAQAAGCSVLTPRFGAAMEINQKKMLVGGRMIYSVPGALQFEVSVESLVKRLSLLASSLEQYILRDRKYRESISRSVKQFSLGDVMKKWIAFIETDAKVKF